VARNAFSRHLDAVAWIVASSATFRTITGAANATAALAFVYYPYADDQLVDIDEMALRGDDAGTAITDTRPRCIVNPGEDWRYERAGMQHWRGQGNCFVSFEFLPTDLKATRATQILEYMDNVGEILEEIMVNSGNSYDSAQPSHLNVIGIELIQGPSEVKEEDDRELFYGTTFAMEWV